VRAPAGGAVALTPTIQKYPSGVEHMNRLIAEDITEDKRNWLIENVEEMFTFPEDEENDQP
jgi:hypothetical protein